MKKKIYNLNFFFYFSFFLLFLNKILMTDTQLTMFSSSWQKKKKHEHKNRFKKNDGNVNSIFYTTNPHNKYTHIVVKQLSSYFINFAFIDIFYVILHVYRFSWQLPIPSTLFGGNKLTSLLPPRVKILLAIFHTTFVTTYYIPFKNTCSIEYFILMIYLATIIQITLLCE